MSPVRYATLLGLAVALALACAAVEALFTLSGSGLSLTDSRGPGQITLFIVIFAGIALFSHTIARVAIFGWFKLYAEAWPRVWRGFLVAFCFGFSVMLLGYVFLAAMGQAGWSAEGWANFSLKTVERTLVALLVVVVLATSEELIFRSFVVRYLRWNTSVGVTVAAVVVGSAIFSVTHLIALGDSRFSSEHLPLLFGLFLLGALLSVTYLATGSLAVAIGVHSGLLGFKVLLRKTQLVAINPEAWWLNESSDIRVSPVAWAVLVAMGLVVFLLRHRLYARFAVERPVVLPDPDANPELVDPRLTNAQTGPYRA